MFTKELFGQRILELRKQNGETQTDLANVIKSGKKQPKAW